MSQSSLFGMIALSMVFAAPVEAKIAGATADGTWDCADVDGAALGALVIADKTYAFIKPDGLLGGYGKLFQTGLAEYHLPHFLVIDGYLKDEIGAVGFGMTGPKDNDHDLSGELFLAIVISETDVPFCVRRVAAAN